MNCITVAANTAPSCMQLTWYGKYIYTSCVDLICMQGYMNFKFLNTYSNHWRA
jgi:hypothetical protein